MLLKILLQLQKKVCSLLKQGLTLYTHYPNFHKNLMRWTISIYHFTI